MTAETACIKGKQDEYLKTVTIDELEEAAEGIMIEFKLHSQNFRVENGTNFDFRLAVPCPINAKNNSLNSAQKAISEGLLACMKMQRDPEIKKAFNLPPGKCQELDESPFEMTDITLKQKYPVHELTVTFSDKFLFLSMENVKELLDENVFDFKVRSGVEYDDVFDGYHHLQNITDKQNSIEAQKLRFTWNITKFKGNQIVF